MAKTVKEILTKNNLYSDEIAKIAYHTNALNIEADTLLRKLKMEGVIPEFGELSELEVSNLLANLIKSCDQESPTFDRAVYEEMMRIGSGLDNTVSRGGNPSKWNNGGMFHDDGFGFGTEPTSIDDDYRDLTDYDLPEGHSR